MNPVLLTVSGKIDPDIQAKVGRGERPQADYLAMAEAFPADLLDYSRARGQAGRLGRLIEKLGGANLMLAWTCFRLRTRYRVIFTDGEQVGLPLAFLLKFLAGRNRPAHLMIAHILSVRKKMLLLDLLGLASHIDAFFVYSTWQRNFIEKRWHLPPGRVVFTPFMVDAGFFSPEAAGADHHLPGLERQDRPLICAAGLEFRDYPTLISAVDGLDVQVVLAAASPWSKRPDTTARQAVPENVIVRRFTQFELRRLYEASQFVVMPLYAVNFQAGVTAILEAMAMEKAVICTRTQGQTDVIREGETGIYVPPDDPDALRKAIGFLLDHPEEAERMGKKGRQLVLEEMSLPCYTRRLKGWVTAACRPIAEASAG